MTPLEQLIVPFIPPSAWRAGPVGDGSEGHVIRRLTVHHTAHLMDDNTAAPGLMRAWQRDHQSRGWPDIAYHYLIDRNGHVYGARDVAYRGDTATSYDPTGHFLVSCMGNFEEQEPTPEQVESLVEVLAAASQLHQVAPSSIAGHKDYAATACPGDSLYSIIVDGSLREQVDQRASAGELVLQAMANDEATNLVNAIEAGEA